MKHMDTTADVNMNDRLSKVCGSTFWNYTLTVNSTTPDLTPCFESTVLVWIPCGFLWSLSPAHFYRLWTRTYPSLKPGWLTTTKLVLSFALFLLFCVQFLNSIYRWSHTKDSISTADFLSSGIIAGTMVLQMYMVEIERLCGLRSAGIPFIFWLLLSIGAIATFQTNVRLVLSQEANKDLFTVVVNGLYMMISVVQLVLHGFANQAPYYLPIDEGQVPCPEHKKGFLVRMFYWWYTGVAFLGYKRPLEFFDLWYLNREDRCNDLVPIFERCWDNELMKMKRSRARIRVEKELGLKQSELYEPSLMKAFAKSYWPIFIEASIYKVLNDILVMVGPQLLKLLIMFIGDDLVPYWHGWLYAIIMFLSAMVRTLCIQKYNMCMVLVGMRVRSSVTAAVYKKALHMTNAARGSSTVGEIVNLMIVDAQRLNDFALWVHWLWSAAFIISLAMYFLWQELGPAVLAGLGLMILLLPLNAVVAHYTKKLQTSQMMYKDSRIKAMNEILSGIKVLKMYAWEPPFGDKVTDVRNQELHVLKLSNYLTAMSLFFWTCAPFLVTLVSFTVYVLSDPKHVLTADKAFVSLSLFNLMRFPMAIIPPTITLAVQSAVACKRLRKYFMNDDLDPNAVLKTSDSDCRIVVENGCFCWNAEVSEKPVLSNINLQVKQGLCFAVVGQVGAGKSSLISAFLGEMEKISGHVCVRGSVAYVAQQAWIQNATLKENILFGKECNDKHYDEVLEACALKPDLEILTGGDATEIGEKGINLSGGQKQRVSLARAAYANADIYLLDDPLSAVDSHVGKHIFEKLVGPKGVLKSKTRILVTHGISFLPQVDQIIVLKEGQISEVGSYKELLNNNGPFADFLRNYLTNADNDDYISDSEDPELVEELLQQVAPDFDVSKLRLRSASSEGGFSSSEQLQKQRSLYESLGSRMSKPKPPANKLIQEEAVETGNVKLSVFLMYFKALTIPISVAIFMGWFVQNSASIYSSIWLSAWTNDEPLPDGSQNITQRNLRLSVYGALGAIQAAFVLLAAVSMALGIMYASRALHFEMLQQILRVPMSFFDTTPLGRIMNRFAKDVDVVDNIIPPCLQNWLFCVFYVLSTLFVISYGTPVFVIVIPPLAVLYFFIQRLYIASSRQLKRLESVSRSPIYNHFSETISGAITIRAYQAQERFIEENEHRIDSNQMCYFANQIANRWLGVHLEGIGNIIVFFSAIFSVINKKLGTIDAGLAGMSVSYALTLIQALNWAVRHSSDLETNIVAVERIKEYAETETEAEWYASEQPTRLTTPPASWPSDGKVHFQNFSVRYRPGMSLVLKNLYFHITGREKIGIIGRTGAGKSSMTLSLFRIIEAADGFISIDGLNIAKMGLHELRSRLTIIPQDPVLFSGDLRMNLDPFSWYSDSAIWHALALAHLKPFVESLGAGLSHVIAEGGENLSVGQRQLVCLARALLRRSKVLILDEATAAIDLETDDLIQQTIRREFIDCTVLTIAHRLNTIMDSTRVMVLDNGEVIEFDSPEQLLQNRNSHFYSMVKDAGLLSNTKEDMQL